MHAGPPDESRREIGLHGPRAVGLQPRQISQGGKWHLKDPEKRPRLGLGWFGLEEELSHILGREVEMIAEGSLSPYLRPNIEKDKVLIYEDRC